MKLSREEFVAKATQDLADKKRKPYWQRSKHIMTCAERRREKERKETQLNRDLKGRWAVMKEQQRRNRWRK